MIPVLLTKNVRQVKNHNFTARWIKFVISVELQLPDIHLSRKLKNIYTKTLLSQLDDHEECVKALLEAGTNVNVENSYKGTDFGTALVQAARQGHVK